jgi:hypothetical protein
MLRTKIVKLPNTNMSLNTLNGRGVGAVLLDGGMGGQSSYHSTDDYYNTTGRDVYTNRINKARPKGGELADKISEKLSKLKISDKPIIKRKNITLNI